MTKIGTFGRTGRSVIRDTQLGNLVRLEVTGVDGVSYVRWFRL